MIQSVTALFVSFALEDAFGPDQVFGSVDGYAHAGGLYDPYAAFSAASRSPMGQPANISRAWRRKA